MACWKYTSFKCWGRKLQTLHWVWSVSVGREHIMNKTNLSKSDFRVEADILVCSSKTSALILIETLQKKVRVSGPSVEPGVSWGSLPPQGGVGLVYILPLLWYCVGLGTRSQLTCGLWSFPPKFFLSKIRAHVATCSKYQNYIMEGVKATTKDASHQPR